VVAHDIVAWRDSVLAEQGSYRGVNRGDWVASRLFVSEGRWQGVAEGQAVMAAECLLGRVEQVSPYMSRVRLFSDVDSPRIEVQIGGLRGGEMQFVDYSCSLRGLGRGRMVIEDVPYRFIEEAGPAASSGETPRIRVGDLVYSAQGMLGLPIPLTIGKIAALKQDPKKRLVYTLIVEHTVAIDEIHDVFIIPLVPAGPLPALE
jgi:cell shape-determining protein MreC